jgi:hypothetical protein
MFIADWCITIYLSDNIGWVLIHLISTMMTSLNVWFPSCNFNSIVLYYLN